MSAPRTILPEQTYLITRRVLRRQLLLRPEVMVRRILRYCLALAAGEHPVAIHAACFLSNHFHLVLTDRDRNLPKFMETFNRSVAKCMNVHRKRGETFWAPGSYSAVRLVQEEDVLAKIVYVLTNPVAARLVSCGDLWPGVRFSFSGIGEEGRAKGYSELRPPVYFDPLGLTPLEATLTISRPERFFQDVSDAELAEAIASAVAAREREIREQARLEGRKFLGREGVLAQDPDDYPWSREEQGQLDPKVACRDKWKRIEVLLALKQFYESYAEALRRWVKGERDVLFPPGTYWMNVLHGARIAPAEAPT